MGCNSLCILHSADSRRRRCVSSPHWWIEKAPNRCASSIIFSQAVCVCVLCLLSKQMMVALSSMNSYGNTIMPHVRPLLFYFRSSSFFLSFFLLHIKKQFSLFSLFKYMNRHVICKLIDFPAAAASNRFLLLLHLLKIQCSPFIHSFIFQIVYQTRKTPFFPPHLFKSQCRYKPIRSACVYFFFKYARTIFLLLTDDSGCW